MRFLMMRKPWATETLAHPKAQPHVTLSPSSAGTTHSSPSPHTVELWTSGMVAWEPALEGWPGASGQ